MEAWRTIGTWMMVTFCVTRSKCRLTCRKFDNPNANVGAGRTPLNTEVIHYVDELSAAPPAWRSDDVQNTAKVSTVTAGSITLGVAVGPRQFIADRLLAKADVIRAMRERVQLCQDLQTEFALFRESLGVSRIKHILRVHGHTTLQEQRAADNYDELETLFPRFMEDSIVQATLTAKASLESGTKECETSRLQHTWVHS